MSDWLVRAQESIAGYPTGLVAGVGVLVVAALFLLLGKTLRVFGKVLIVFAIIAMLWFAWRYFFPDDAQPVRTRGETEQLPG